VSENKKRHEPMFLNGNGQMNRISINYKKPVRWNSAFRSR